MKSLIAACAMGVIGLSAYALPAKADVDVDINLGTPRYFDYRVGPDYRFRDGYGWYRPVPRDVYRGRLSCSEARRIVRRSGYRDVLVRDCSGRTYTFEARRGGRYVLVYVNSRNGRIWRG